MARKRSSNKNTSGACGTILWIIIILAIIGAVMENATTIAAIAILVGLVALVIFIIKKVVEKKEIRRQEKEIEEQRARQEAIILERKALYDEVSRELNLDQLTSKLKQYDDIITVKSQAALDNYTDVKYLKENDVLEKVAAIVEERKPIYKCLTSFIKHNEYETRPHYDFVKMRLLGYINQAEGYTVRVNYITPAGNLKESKTLCIRSYRIEEIVAHPEILMSKAEYNKYIKQQGKEALDSKKHLFYDRVNSIIDYTNESRENLVVKSKGKEIDELVQKLFDGTVNSIQKVKDIDSDEWTLIEKFIDTIDEQIHSIVQLDQSISSYYSSEDFIKIKDTCNLLMESQKDFNEYISEKAQSITKLFGTRVVRNETQHEDTYNYIRAYKKTITPFTAEVSATVFSSAENNPIPYVIKLFYPNRSQYPAQIEKLRLLIEELETLREAKDIIENYKKDYDQYVKDVPDYILENDEEGFYSRLGLTIIDEDVLNIEYKFVYTSNGGMAQRSFTIPMNEENITELIHQLESKLTNAALVKEQRALMTTKLRKQIKERDNYTCCQCGNSIHEEPNLLLEIDHIIPVSKGGLTQEDNLQTLCWKCNRSKGAKMVVANDS